MTDHHTAKRIEEFAGTFGPADSEIIEILLVLASALEGSPGGLDRLCATSALAGSGTGGSRRGSQKTR